MNRKFFAVLALVALSLTLVFTRYTTNSVLAQSDKAFENANNNSSFLKCDTKHPDEETARLIADANDSFRANRKA